MKGWVVMSKLGIVSFYHEEGLTPSWNLAKKFAGTGGRIATLPDIIELRLNSDRNDHVWNTWFTTNSAEYFGIGKDGRKKIIVAHGVGPMSSLEGILKAYSHEYKDKSRSKSGGRISQQEFLDLESGRYGDVKVFDYDTVVISFHFSGVEYPFIESLTYKQCLRSHLLYARLGQKADQYIETHAKITGKESGEDYKTSNRKVIELSDSSNCCYQYWPIEDGWALAHLLTISRLGFVTTQGEQTSLRSEISCHEWFDGTKFIGIRKNSVLQKIDEYADGTRLLEKNWKNLMVPVKDQPYNGIRRIINFENQQFVEYPKKGSGIDNGEPEFLVLSKEPVGGTIEFKTTAVGGGLFFKYELREVSFLAPPESNTYSFVGNIRSVTENGQAYHVTGIQFYWAKIDYSKRLIRANQLAQNYDRMIELIDQ